MGNQSRGDVVAHSRAGVRAAGCVGTGRPGCLPPSTCVRARAPGRASCNQQRSVTDYEAGASAFGGRGRAPPAEGVTCYVHGARDPRALSREAERTERTERPALNCSCQVLDVRFTSRVFCNLHSEGGGKTPPVK